MQPRDLSLVELFTQVTVDWAKCADEPDEPDNCLGRPLGVYYSVRRKFKVEDSVRN